MTVLGNKVIIKKIYMNNPVANNEKSEIAVVIPVYNNHETLRDVVKRTLEVQDTVIVVDDGSTIPVKNILEGLLHKIHLVRHDKNKGKGKAILSSVSVALKLGMTHIVTVDADAQHHPEDIINFIPMIKKNPFAILVGCRDFSSPNIPGSTRFGRKFSNFWLRLQTGKSLGDAQSGFRAYPLFVLENLNLREKRFSFEIEVLVKAAWAGIELMDVPVSVYYPHKDKRVSHFNKFSDNLQLTILNTHLTMRSVLPWPHRKIINDEMSGKKISVLHPIRSIRSLLTEQVSPEKLACAAALGVFLGTLPLIACHTIAIIFATGFLRLNKVAAISASQLCMPPLVPAICIEIGHFILNGHFLTEISVKTIGYQAIDRLLEWVIGSIIFAPVIAVITGLVVYIMSFNILRDKNAGQ